MTQINVTIMKIAVIVNTEPIPNQAANTPPNVGPMNWPKNERCESHQILIRVAGETGGRSAVAVGMMPPKRSRRQSSAMKPDIVHENPVAA